MIRLNRADEGSIHPLWWSNKSRWMWSPISSRSVDCIGAMLLRAVSRPAAFGSSNCQILFPIGCGKKNPIDSMSGQVRIICQILWPDMDEEQNLCAMVPDGIRRNPSMVHNAYFDVHKYTFSEKGPTARTHNYILKIRVIRRCATKCSR